MTRILVIDDDPVNNIICRQTIKNLMPDIEIITFLIPEKGFEFIEKEYSKEYGEPTTILFLDINMPTWSGWEFLENFEHLAIEIKKQIRIYMLSSSVDQKDMERALTNVNVSNYIKKPLNKTKLLEHFTF